MTVSAKAGESGRLFGAITTAEIADAVKAAGGPSIDRRKVEVAQPIKPSASTTCRSACTPRSPRS